MSPLLDVSRLIWRAWQHRLPTGIDRTCLAYVAHFRDRAGAVAQRGGLTCVLSDESSRRVFDLLLDTGPDFRSQLARLMVSCLVPRRQVSLNGRVYLNVGHTGLNRRGHSDWLKRTGVQPVYFVHDLIPLTHPEYCRAGEPERHLRRMQALVTNAVGVIGNSRETMNELAVFAGLQGDLAMPPSLVAPLGVLRVPAAQADRWRARLPARPYFVMLGTIEGRKNHLLMLNIWAEMARRLGPSCPQLVIIGQRGWESEQVIDMLERCEVIRGHVIELPRCGDEQLAACMAGARALLFPSFVEGYGLPLVEALACGTPVIASDLSVFRELAGDIPDYLSPIDGAGWSFMIEDYARTESGARSRQCARLQGWQPPQWSDHFGRVERWIEQFRPAPRPASVASG